jgi:hypothetical protein
MYLYEEYANRLNLKSHIFKRDNSIVYLENSTIVLIEKKLNFNQPNSYNISICEPETNKGRSVSFFNVISKDEVEWDDYDNYIFNFCKSSNRALENSNDILIRSWELFLIYNDEYFSKNINYNVLYKTIDLNENRIKHIEDFILFLRIHNAYYYEMWQQMNKNIINYSYWLAKLINSL